MPTPRVKNPKNVTARELMGYDDTLVPETPGEPGPPDGPLEIPDDSMAVFSGGWLLEMLALGEDETACFPGGEDWRDARGRTHVRGVVKVHTAGAAASRLVIKFTTDADADSNDPTEWTHAGALATEVPVSMASAGTHRSLGWFPLHASARTDARWQMFAVGGDGVETPVVSDAQIQWRTAAELPLEDLYWRDLPPAAQPPENEIELGLEPTIEDQTAYTGYGTTTDVGRSFGLCDPALGQDLFITPTVAEVQASPGLLLRTKATTDLGATVFAGSGADERKDIGGWIGRLVGAPLAAQAVPAFAYEHWFVAVAPSAFTDGTVFTHLWVWRPGVGRILLGMNGGMGVFAESYAGGFNQKYVRFANRQCRNWGVFPAFTALAGDRFILDIGTLNITDCGGASHNQGLGTWVGFNGTGTVNNPEGLATLPGYASRTRMARLRYIGDT